MNPYKTNKLLEYIMSFLMDDDDLSECSLSDVDLDDWLKATQKQEYGNKNEYMRH